MVPTAQDLLAPLPERALRRASRVLADAFGRTLLISTLHDGERLEDADEAARDDLAALADALPEGRLRFDCGARDTASGEPFMLTAIRQAEGAPPALPAVLMPRTPDEAEMLLAEASAAGFEPRPEGKRRPIGLSFSDVTDVGIGGDKVRIGNGTSWVTLDAFAERAGRGLPQAALAGRFDRPSMAADAGLFADAEVDRVAGEIASVRLDLPPAAVGATDRSWFVPEAAAINLLSDVVALYTPLYAEVLTALDVRVLHAAGALRGKPNGRAVLRAVFDGTRGVRAAATREANAYLTRAGGRLCRRGPLPSEHLLAALAATSGAARFVVGEAPHALPPAAIRTPVAQTVRNRTIPGEVVWYPRDLARSLDQAEAVLKRPAASDAAAAETLSDDEGWEALRAALAEALP